MWPSHASCYRPVLQPEPRKLVLGLGFRIEYRYIVDAASCNDFASMWLKVWWIVLCSAVDAAFSIHPFFLQFLPGSATLT